jgi:hypothetical protein
VLTQRKSWRTRIVFLIVLWLVLLLASLTILSSVVTPFLKSLQTENLVSFDWGGYGVASNLLVPQPQVSSVTGSWTIPTVAVYPPDAFSAAWIGIGGLGDPTLIQTGSQHDSAGGQAHYSLWYELLPANSVTITTVRVSPGDVISASITLVDSATNEWSIQINDVTTGQGFSQNFAYNSSRLTAEWIVERPTVNSQLATLADFGSITFTGMNAQVGSSTGTLTAFPNYKSLMEDRQNNVLVRVSDFSKDGSSFTVSYA